MNLRVLAKQRHLESAAKSAQETFLCPSSGEYDGIKDYKFPLSAQLVVKLGSEVITDISTAAGDESMNDNQSFHVHIITKSVCSLGRVRTGGHCSFCLCSTKNGYHK